MFETEWGSLWELKIWSETKSLFPSCDTEAKFILFKNIKQEIEKRIYNFPWNRKIYKPQNTELQKFLPPFLYFWKYNPSPNGQIISLAGAQVHLQIQLLRDECYKLLKIFFFFLLNSMKTPVKVQRIVGPFLGCRPGISTTFRRIFAG